MAIRKCPQCLAVIPPGVAAAFSDTIECPGCKTPLEVSTLSRHVAIWPGLLVAAAVWYATRGGEGMLAWALPVLFAFLAFSVTSAVITMFTSDLRGRPPEPVAPPAGDAGHGHSSAHH